MAEPLPNEDQSPASGFQADATGVELMALLLSAVQPADLPILFGSVATGGDPATLQDTAQDWTPEQWTGHALFIEHASAVTQHRVIGNVESVLGFLPPLGVPIEATGLVGSGESPEGQVLCTLVGKGADGDNWVLHLISEADGVEGSMTNVIGADVENKVITVFIDTNALGQQQQLWAGSLAQLLSESVPGHISAATEVISGSLPLGTVEAPVVVTFSGGVDTAAVTAGDRYWLVTTAYATPEQGALANTAVQPDDLGSAAATDADAYATAAQGALAASAVQPPAVSAVTITAGAIATPLDGSIYHVALTADVSGTWSAPIPSGGNAATTGYFATVIFSPPGTGEGSGVGTDGPWIAPFPVGWSQVGGLDSISLAPGDDPIVCSLASVGEGMILVTAVSAVEIAA